MYAGLEVQELSRAHLFRRVYSSAKSSLGRSANAMGGAAWNSRGGLASEHAYTVPDKSSAVHSTAVVVPHTHTHNTVKVPSAKQASSVVNTTLVLSHAQKTSIT